MSRLRSQLWCLIVLLIGLTGCMATGQFNHRKMDASWASKQPLLGAQKPVCAAIVMAGAAVPATLQQSIEGAAERHLLVHLNQVVSAPQTRRLAARLRLDLSHPKDRQRFAKRLSCDYVFEVTVTVVEDVFMVIWAHRSLGLQARLVALKDNQTIWRGHHQSHQGDGGVPVSLISVPFAISRAIQVQTDPTGSDKIAEETLRLLLKSLPDFRDRRVLAQR